MYAITVIIGAVSILIICFLQLRQRILLTEIEKAGMFLALK